MWICIFSAPFSPAPPISADKEIVQRGCRLVFRHCLQSGRAAFAVPDSNPWRNTDFKENNVHRYSVQSLIALTLVANLSLGMAAAPAVGIATARGSFTIDDSSIAGNATLFEGNHIETGRISSPLQLNNGARMQLAAESRGIVYRDRLVLEKGMGRVENAGTFQVEANSLRIAPASEAAAQVSLRPSGMVEVAALNGPVRVTASNGMLLASLQAGKTIDFTPEATPGPAAPTTVTGCLESSGGKFLLTEEASLVRFEMTGTGLEKEVGHRVQISGMVNPVPDSMSKSRVHRGERAMEEVL
jgi:hypothetical protein